MKALVASGCLNCSAKFDSDVERWRVIWPVLAVRSSDARLPVRGSAYTSGSSILRTDATASLNDDA